MWKPFSHKDFNKKGKRLRRHSIPTLNLSVVPLTDSQLAELPQHVWIDKKDDLPKAATSTSQLEQKSLVELSQNAISRAFSCSSVSKTKQWRMARGLSVNRNAEGILTDGPDYTFLDGRPTPLLHKQKLRMLKHQGFASRIVELSSELDFAKDRYQKMIQAKEEEKQRVISNRLKPKGKALKNK